MRILIVDDEPGVRSSLRAMLCTDEVAKLEVDEAGSGQAALDLLAERPANLVITDMKMPGLSGIELIERLRQFAYGGEIAVISGFDDYQLVRTAMKLGASDYLLKPVDRSELMELVRAVRRRHAGREVRALTQTPGDRLRVQMMRSLHGERAEDVAGWFLLRVSADMAAPPPAEAELILSEYRGGRQVCVWRCESEAARARALGSAQDMMAFDYAGGLGSLLEQACRAADDRFFDLPPQSGDLQELLSLAAQAFARYEDEQACAQLDRLFSALCAQRGSVEAVRQVPAALLHQVQQENSAYIRVTARHELTQDDLVRVTSNSSHLSTVLGETRRLMLLYMREARAETFSQDELHLQKAIAYINEHYADDLSLTQVAQVLHLHPNYFSTIFTRALGVSYSRYLRRVRIDTACRLMQTTHMKLYEIAEAVGYHDHLQFNRAFRHEKGIPPSKYSPNQQLNTPDYRNDCRD